MNDYQAKFVTPEQAVKAVQSGDWVDYGFGAGFPELLDKALAARKGEVKDVKVRGGLVIRPRIEIVEADPEQESFSYYSWHIGDYERKLQKNGLVKFMPVMLRSLPYLYRDKHIRCDVAFVPVSKPDENGYCGLGISNYAWRTIFESARTVIFEINEHYPKLQGMDGSHRVHLSEADYIVEGEHEPLPVRSYRAPSETDIAIAKIVVNEIPDGAVLSLGVGGVPYTVAKMLAESDKKDLGCHTGTISDAFLELYKAGKLTNARKELEPAFLRGTLPWALRSSMTGSTPSRSFSTRETSTTSTPSSASRSSAASSASTAACSSTSWGKKMPRAPARASSPASAARWTSSRARTAPRAARDSSASTLRALRRMASARVISLPPSPAAARSPRRAR